jgi:glutamate racemase
MHVLITDSGVGGLSVCAYAERFARTRGLARPVRLTFVNAAPRNDYGYNSMPSRQVKLDSFDRFLSIVSERYAPDLVYVACNTLSVLLPDTRYVRDGAIPVKGIVDTGVEVLVRELEVASQSLAMIFGTPTTIDERAYPQRLERRGVAGARIVEQACPGLADTISEDRAGVATAAQIARWVGAAVAKLRRTDERVVACLACTHYGYRKQLFADALAMAGLDATVVDPNERASDDLFGAWLDDAVSPVRADVEVEVVTRYAIPDETISALTSFLADTSPPTVAALQRFVHAPDLF